MVRAAAKNHPSVAIITSPDQYDQLRTALAAGGFTLAQRKALAAAAFVHTATYDVAVASWMGNVLTDSSRRGRVPGLAGRHLGQGRDAALRRERAPAGSPVHAVVSGPGAWPPPSSCTARR